jgi:hypothetical protein
MEAHGPLGQAIETIEKGLERLVEAAAATATTFGFPLSLTVLVLIFLMIQNRLDRKDPKLANAPLHSYQDVARFTDGNGP